MWGRLLSGRGSSQSLTASRMWFSISCCCRVRGPILSSLTTVGSSLILLTAGFLLSFAARSAAQASLMSFISLSAMSSTAERSMSSSFLFLALVLLRSFFSLSIIFSKSVISRPPLCPPSPSPSPPSPSDAPFFLRLRPSLPPFFGILMSSSSSANPLNPPSLSSSLSLSSSSLPPKISSCSLPRPRPLSSSESEPLPPLRSLTLASDSSPLRLPLLALLPLPLGLSSPSLSLSARLLLPPSSPSLSLPLLSPSLSLSFLALFFVSSSSSSLSNSAPMRPLPCSSSDFAGDPLRDLLPLSLSLASEPLAFLRCFGFLSSSESLSSNTALFFSVLRPDEGSSSLSEPLPVALCVGPTSSSLSRCTCVVGRSSLSLCVGERPRSACVSSPLSLCVGPKSSCVSSSLCLWVGPSSSSSLLNTLLPFPLLLSRCVGAPPSESLPLMFENEQVTRPLKRVGVAPSLYLQSIYVNAQLFYP
eukprot:comp22251_c1_seq1/m.32865 comp22251_c1_seq1/g.32865  ORF comp22251_c1_seq1/g.32865 comp22251_c1_seq1/m.32865 type:complete len:475 (+) comp22251_c1_seq1:776-2200(+)